ncbi:MAG: tRNA (adenosine(37)-N6)-threonylcarbamoyltransferase complex dimerization subunit type 1 TsaB [Patescibacteria group bacterium]
MLVLTIRTDNPEAELGLFNDSAKLDYQEWPAHRELAETIHRKIEDLLSGQQKALEDIQGLIVYKGPGSFTGLRIGITVANTLADALNVPIVGASGEDWQRSGIDRLQNEENETVILPEYGSLPKTTTPKH